MEAKNNDKHIDADTPITETEAVTDTTIENMSEQVEADPTAASVGQTDDTEATEAFTEESVADARADGDSDMVGSHSEDSIADAPDTEGISSPLAATELSDNAEVRTEENTTEAEPATAADSESADEPEGEAEQSAEDTGADSKDEARDTVPSPTEENGDSEDGKKNAKRRMIDTVFDFVELFVFTLVTVLVITSFFVRQSVVDGVSMQNTLHGGDNLLISDFMYEPKAGDIIVCEDFSKFNKPIVKRVIATEGQTVRFTADTVYVDGVALDEPYVYLSNPAAFSYLDSFAFYYNLRDDFWAKDEKYGLNYVEDAYYEITVPEGELFVMGDHRDMSEDSRARGTMKVDSVLGKVLIRFYPFDLFGAVE